MSINDWKLIKEFICNYFQKRTILEENNQLQPRISVLEEDDDDDLDDDLEAEDAHEEEKKSSKKTSTKTTSKPKSDRRRGRSRSEESYSSGIFYFVYIFRNLCYLRIKC